MWALRRQNSVRSSIEPKSRTCSRSRQRGKVNALEGVLADDVVRTGVDNPGNQVVNPARASLPGLGRELEETNGQATVRGDLERDVFFRVDGNLAKDEALEKVRVQNHPLVNIVSPLIPMMSFATLLVRTLSYPSKFRIRSRNTGEVEGLDMFLGHRRTVRRLNLPAKLMAPLPMWPIKCETFVEIDPLPLD